MRRLLPASLAVLLLLPSLFGQARAEDNSIILHDEFRGVMTFMPDGSSKLYPDRNTWAFTFWPGSVWPDSYGDGTNWLAANGESQTYLSPFISSVLGRPVPSSQRYNPFKIDADGLHIQAAILSSAQQYAYRVGGHRRFGSGMLRSRQSFTYGRIRLIAKLPSNRGSWPAFWLLPQARIWPPEIDIFEGMAWKPHGNQIHAGMIVPQGETGTTGKWFDIGTDPSKNFHEYGLDWNEHTLTVTFDSKVVLQSPTPPSMRQPMYLLINLAVGGKWPCNELGIQPIDSLSPDRLNRCANTIANDYPAEMVIRSVSVEKATP